MEIVFKPRKVIAKRSSWATHHKVKVFRLVLGQYQIPSNQFTRKTHRHTEMIAIAQAHIIRQTIAAFMSN